MHHLGIRGFLSLLPGIFVSHCEREQMSFAIVITFVLDTVIDEFVGHEVEATARSDYHHKYRHLNDKKTDVMEKRNRYNSHTFLSIKYHVN